MLDCPELPLNVSRSYLQNNAYVSKVSAHIVKKVCDKLTGMFNTDREAYEKLWSDLKVFVEYACLRDRKFYDRVKKRAAPALTSGGFRTVDEYLEAAKAKAREHRLLCDRQGGSGSVYLDVRERGHRGGAAR